MSMVGFPLLLIPLAIYNIFVFLMPGVAFIAPIVNVTLMSRAQWTLTFGDALLALAMILLWFEIVKASRPGARFLTDHLLSLIVFGVAAAEFLLIGKFGNSTFFLLTVLTAVEFLAGVSVGLRHRKLAKYAAAHTRHEPEPEREDDHTPIDQPAPARSQPSLATRVEPKLTETKPPEMMTVSPAHKTPAETSQPDATAAPARKVTGWTVADLVRDEPPSDEKPKP